MKALLHLLSISVLFFLSVTQSVEAGPLIFVFETNCETLLFGSDQQQGYELCKMALPVPQGLVTPGYVVILEQGEVGLSPEFWSDVALCVDVGNPIPDWQVWLYSDIEGIAWPDDFVENVINPPPGGLLPPFPPPQETGVEGANFALYTPLAGQQGFFPAMPTYVFVSEGPAPVFVPESTTMTLLVLGLAALGARSKLSNQVGILPSLKASPPRPR